MNYIANAKLSPPDDRDYVFTATASEYNSLPSMVDLRSYVGEIENQLSTNSCVANAVVSALELSSKKHNKDINLSRLFLYYNLRESYDNLKEIDGGAYLRDGFKSVSKLGICTEDTWSFTLENVNIKPSGYSYFQALKYKVTRYERVIPGPVFDRHTTITKTALAKGYPVILTLQLGRLFYSLTGPLDTHSYAGVNNDSVGYHAMCIVGYDDALGGFIVENSWGNVWGDNGLFLLKYDVFLKDCPEAWVCTGFDGINYDPDWVDTSPDLVLDKEIETIIHYKEDGNTFTVEVNVVSGLKPLAYDWSISEETGDFITDNGLSSISFIKRDSNTGDSIIQCRVTASDPLKKQANKYFILKYIDEYKVKPADAFIDDSLNITIKSLLFAGDIYDVVLSYKKESGSWVMSSIIEK